MGVIFDEELKKLRTRFMEMGIDASEQIYKAAKAFTDHDSALAREVLATDAQINDEEISLEKRALKLMALQQPLASDFRKIISILKASNDVERLGDYATHIARSAINFDKKNHNGEIEKEIEKMTEIVRQMLEKVMDAYVYTNEKAAYEVADQDLKVDMNYVTEQKRVLAAMMKNQAAIPALETYMTVIRNLERAGDHIVNLAEWVIYIGAGKLVELNPGKTDPDLVKRKLGEAK